MLLVLLEVCFRPNTGSQEQQLLSPILTPVADIVSRHITGDQNKTGFNLPLFPTEQMRQYSRQRSPSPRSGALHPAVRLGVDPRIRSSRSP